MVSGASEQKACLAQWSQLSRLSCETGNDHGSRSGDEDCIAETSPASSTRGGSGSDSGSRVSHSHLLFRGMHPFQLTGSTHTVFGTTFNIVLQGDKGDTVAGIGAARL